MLPFKSLDAATSAPTVGASKDLESVRANHTIMVTATGSPSSFSVSLEGSHDGDTWLPLATVTGVADTGHSNRALRYVRARLNSMSGGTSPTMTATIASA